MGPSVGRTSRSTRTVTWRTRSSRRRASWSMMGRHFSIGQKRVIVVVACSRHNAVQRRPSAKSRDVYRCPAGEKLKFHYANEEHGQKMRRYWTNACKTCALKDQCTTGKERRSSASRDCSSPPVGATPDAAHANTESDRYPAGDRPNDQSPDRWPRD